MWRFLSLSFWIAGVFHTATAQAFCEMEAASTCTNNGAAAPTLEHSPPPSRSTSGDDVHAIIRGEPVAQGTYPWMIYANGCSASLISPSYVLMAAHCFGQTVHDQGTLEGLEFSSAPVLFGHPDRTSDQITRHEVAVVHMHPDYLPLTVEERWGLEPYDVALLELAEPILLNGYIRLPTRDPIPGEGVIAAGWGLTESGQQPAVLQEAVLTVSSDDDCYVGDEIRFCTEGNDVRSNVAAGDSGGPVFVNDGDGFMVLGTNSAANGDAARPVALHARTIAFVPWILSVAGEEFWCTGEGEDAVCEADIDECTLGLDTCGEHGRCENTVAAYTCQCDDGFNFDGASCIADPEPAPAGCRAVARSSEPVWWTWIGLAALALAKRRRPSCAEVCSS